jgi:GNAT superfamily N-acetyltransferase
MSIRIESPQGRAALAEMIRFYDRVYAYRSARWPAFEAFELAVLSGESPYLRARLLRPFVAREHGEIAARVIAVVDERYRRHWNERLGHLVMFEALPASGEAVWRLIDEASAWLAAHGCARARAGYGMLDLPFAIDAYESLPPTILRQNPPYYHALLKEAGFETEKGWVDYCIEVCPAHLESWHDAVAAARRRGFEIVPLRRLPRSVRARRFADTWNAAFAHHWGHTPTDAEEFSFLIRSLEPAGVLDTSVVALLDGEVVGVVWAVRADTGSVRLAPHRVLADAERLNILAIGVRESARGQGVNLALAGHAYLELARRGARAVSYTLVLDDNWPSRRTAEKLGGRIRANYVSYVRDFAAARR